MNTYIRFRRSIAWLVIASLTLTQSAQVAALTLASAPLAATTTAVVRPNLMYVLDDSGSMNWDFTPDYINDATVAADPGSTGGSPGDGALATVVGGVVTAIGPDGSPPSFSHKYMSKPDVVIEGGGGTGASASATYNASTQRVTAINVASGGTGYTSTPFVALVGPISNGTWGMCWGVAGGKPLDTTKAPTCTSMAQPPYSASAINYQYYDPAIRYLPPVKADGTSYANSNASAAKSDGFAGTGSLNLTTSWPHEVWCNTATPSPTPNATNIATHTQCKENTSTANDALYPNALYTFRVTYLGPASYYTMSPSEYCTDTEGLNCVRSTVPMVSGSSVFNIASNYRWCAYYNPNTHTYGACQGRRDQTHFIPNYLGGWVTTGTPGTQATANMVIGPIGSGIPAFATGQQLQSITVGGADIVGGTTFTVGATDTPSTIATAVCAAVNANASTSGYGCSVIGSTAQIQSAIAGTAQNGLAVIAAGPPGTDLDKPHLSLTVVDAINGAQIDSILIQRIDGTSTEMLSASATQRNNDIGDTAQEICNQIKSGPAAAVYDVRSRDVSDTTVPWGTCRASENGLIEIQNKTAVSSDDGATLTLTGPNGNSGTITVGTPTGPTVINDIQVGGTSVVASGVTKPWYYDGTKTAAQIAADMASKIGASGCSATAIAERIFITGITGACTAPVAPATTAITVVSNPVAPTAALRVISSGTTDKGNIANIEVGTTTVVGNTTFTDGTAVAANATTLRSAIGSGFTATAPVASGTGYNITVTAPAGAYYNGKQFTVGAGTPDSGAGGHSPIWTFPINDATLDNVDLTSITCGGTVAVATRNTGTTTASTSYVENLAVGTSTNGLNGKTSAGLAGYSYACTNASMTAPAYRCTVTGPVGPPACSNLAITKDATISLSTTSPAAAGGAAATPNTWSYTITDAQTDSRLINRIRCSNSSPPVIGTPSTSGGARVLVSPSTVSTGSTSTQSYEQNLATSLMSNFDPDGNYWAGSSSCTPSVGAGTVSCTFAKLLPDCTSAPTIALGTGLSATTPTHSGTNWSFTISGASAANRTVTSITCPQLVNVPTAGAATGDGGGAASAPDLASDIIGALNSTYWDVAGSSCTGTGFSSTDRQVVCNLKPTAGGICDTTTAPIVTPDNLTITGPTLVSGKWHFSTNVGSFNTGDGISSITCLSSSTETHRAVGDNTGTTGTVSSRKLQRLENLRTALNGHVSSSGLFTTSCPTASIDPGGFSCTVTGPSTCTSPTLYFLGSSSSTGIYIGGTELNSSGQLFGSFTSGSSGSSPTWQFDILNATAPSKTISAITCGGSSILPASAPSTGTAPASTNYQRINNLTGAVPPASGSLSSNGYTLSCTPATSTTPTAACTLTGPVGVAACGAGADFVITKDSSIAIGTVTRTDAGAASDVPTIDFAPYILNTTNASGVLGFSGGYDTQNVSTTPLQVLSTITVAPNPATFSNGAPSGVTIPTNTAGTPAGGSLNMAGGTDPDPTANHWTGVGIFNRVDIVASDPSYSRASGRTDCAGTTCSYAEELQNFANWYSYYRTRTLLMKSATTLAFSQLDGNNYRIGFDNICSATGTTVKEKVARFVDSGGEVASQKSNWWTNVVNSNPTCATPLRAETAKIGKYFAHTLGTVTDPIEYSCQQNFMILVTDGYWNEGDPSNTHASGSGDVGNVDNNSSTVARPYYDGQMDSTTCPTLGFTRSSPSSCRTLADITWHYYSTDLRSATLGNTTNALGVDISTNNVMTTANDSNNAQHMNFYAMGLGINGTLSYRDDYQTAASGDFANIKSGSKNWPAVSNLDPTGVDDLWHATVNGHGRYFSARNLPSVVTGLRAALNEIGARVGSAAAAATSNLEPVAGDNFAYVASYTTVDWVGDLQSRSINVDTGDVSPDTNCATSGSGCQWSAQALLDNMVWSARRIYIQPSSLATGDPLRAFTYSNLSPTEAGYFNPSTLSQYAILSVSNATDITDEKLVNFLRGDRSLEQDGEIAHAQIWRKRSHVLGDIVNTQPVFMKAPNNLYDDAGYADFKTTGTAATRKPAVFVSAQDGMLHAFNAYTSSVTIGATVVQPGEELWAYIPQQAMAAMKVLGDVNYTHRYFVDGQIKVADVNFGGGSTDWHTILVAGLGGGGTSYFALDVTDPLNPRYLWEFSDTNLGYTFANAGVTKLPTGQWAVLFSSGYNNTDGTGKLYAVNPKTGAIIAGYPISNGSGAPGTPSNLGKVALWVDDPLTNNTSQYAYAGDLNGDLWRFDLDYATAGHTGVQSFKLAHLASGGVAQPITTKPELAQLSDGTRVVYVGTGKYLEIGDLTNTAVQSFYAIKDTLGGENLGGPGQTTWDPQTDTVSVAGVPSPAFLQRKFISTDDLGHALTVTTSSGSTVNVRKVCSGASSTVSASTGLCEHEGTVTMDWSTYGGWYVNFPDSGERMNVDLKLVLGTLVFATNIPSADSCTVGGKAWINQLLGESGLPVPGGSGFTGTYIPDALAVGVTVVKLASGQYKSIVTKSNYQEQTFDVDVPPGTSGTPGGFLGKRSMWREFDEGY